MRPMFTLVFISRTASFRLHAQGCSAASRVDHGKNQRYAWPDAFPTVEAAYAFAQRDEWERRSDDTALENVKPYGWKLCKCCNQ